MDKKTKLLIKKVEMLIKYMPTGESCLCFHHGKRMDHLAYEPCPAKARFENTLNDLQEYIENLRKEVDYMNAPEKIYWNQCVDFYQRLYCTYHPYNNDDIEYIRSDLITQWLTIEQAPRDGTPVDLWAKFGRIADCTWEWEQGWPREHYWKDSRGNFVDNPTHFMYVQKPPESI